MTLALVSKPQKQKSTLMKHGVKQQLGSTQSVVNSSPGLGLHSSIAVPTIQTKLNIGKSDNKCVQRQQERQQSTSSCPTFVSLRVAGPRPTIVDRRGTCRLKVGSNCSTPRGSCGSSPTAGAVYRGRITVPAGCQGTLGLLQNIRSSNRRLNLANGTSQCFRVTSRHLDGGIPWKGCQVAVRTAGTYEITSTDCPSIVLFGRRRASRSHFNNPRSVVAADAFRMYLMWKSAGSRSWQPIANADWGWGGTATMAPRATPSTPCQRRYTVSRESFTSGTGRASTEMPVSKPHIRDVSYSTCP